jgi:hypothetical protein
MASSRLRPDGKTGNTELMTGDRNILNKLLLRDLDASQSFLGHLFSEEARVRAIQAKLRRQARATSNSRSRTDGFLYR